MQHPPQLRQRVPIGALVALAFVALAIVAGLAAIFWNEWRLFSAAYPLAADLLRFVVFAAPVSLAIGYAYTGLLIVWRRYGEREQICADKVIGLAKAQRQFPDALHSLSFHDSHKEVPQPPMLALPEPESVKLTAIPTFAQLLDQGQIGPNRPFILGYAADTGQAITGSWKDLYSCGVGAQQLPEQQVVYEVVNQPAEPQPTPVWATSAPVRKEDFAAPDPKAACAFVGCLH